MSEPHGEMTPEEANLRAELTDLLADEFSYQRKRKELAERYGINLSVVDRIRRDEQEIREKRKRREGDEGKREREPWHEPVVGTKMLDEMEDTLLRFVKMEREDATAGAQWVVHAHAHEASDISPILLLSSPTKGCGKSTLLDVIERLVPRPMLGADSTAAALYRSTHLRPTLLVDEADMWLSENRQAVSFLNAGHRRGVPFRRCEGDDNRVVEFDSWCPKAIAQIGMPRWSQLIDRSVVITLRRKLRDENVERFRKVQVYPELEGLARRCQRWAADHLESLRELDPDMPDWFENRLADNWHALFAIADEVGGRWPEHAREAAKRIAQREGVGLDVQLLADIHEVFESGRRMVGSKHLVELLHEKVERPWATRANNGKPITANWLAEILAPFGVRPERVRVESGNQVRGYQREQFEDAWRRYLSLDEDGGQSASDWPSSQGQPVDLIP
jgi:putative DNA primase/helicase